ALPVAPRIDAFEHRGDQRIGGWGLFVGVANPQAAAQIEVVQANAVRLHRFHEIEHAVQCVEVGPGLGDLRADVAVDADDLDACEGDGVPIDVDGALVRDAELVAFEAGRD